MAALDLVGDIDFYSALGLQEQVDAISLPPHSGLVVNLSRVNSMDSSGLAVLVRAYRKMRALEGTVILVGPNQTLQRLLQVTGLAKLLHVAPTERDALASLTPCT